MPLDRRKHKRFKLKADTTAQIIDQKGSPVGSELYGCLQDISVGGACFTIPSSNEDVGIKLLEKMATLTIQFKEGPLIKAYGTVIGAKFDLASSYAIHLKFSQQYSKEVFKKLIDICQKLKSLGRSKTLQNESEDEAKESQAKAEAELANVQQELENEMQPPKALGEAKAQEILKEAPPQKPMPSRKEIVALTQAIKKNPRDVKLTLKLANLYIRSELYEEAIESLKAAIKFSPKVAELQFLLGDAYFRAERFEESLAPLTLAVRLNPKLAKAHHNLWMVNELVGREEAAQMHYRIAITLDPNLES